MDRKSKIEIGDYYEDCSYQPMICVEIDKKDETHITGVSLINGDFRSCSTGHCGTIKLSLEEAMISKKKGPHKMFEREEIELEQIKEMNFKWWSHEENVL